MIREIKKRIKRVIDERIDLAQKEQNSNLQTLLDFQFLSRLFGDNEFIPFTNWSLSPKLILHVLNDITINHRKKIIEFGAGASTFYIAKLIKTMELESKFFSIESDYKWMVELNRLLKIYNLEDYVEVIHADIKSAPESLLLKNQKTWYDVEKLSDVLNKEYDFDVVLIDGPIGNSTPYARYSALPFLRGRLASKFSIFLDDTNREDEFEIAQKWKSETGSEIKNFSEYVLLCSSEGFDFLPYQISK